MVDSPSDQCVWQLPTSSIYNNSPKTKSYLYDYSTEGVALRVLCINENGENLFGSEHPVYRAIKTVIMRMKTQFAKRLCQSYQRKCQRLNQAIILCYKTLQIAFQSIPGISLAWVK